MISADISIFPIGRVYSFKRLYKNTVVAKNQTKLSPSSKVLLCHSALANYKLCHMTSGFKKL